MELRRDELIREEDVCKSCEILKYEIERLRADNDKLLNRVLEKPEPPVERTSAPALTAIPPKAVPWAIRRQMLEEESRARARSLANAAKPENAITTEELERDVLDAETEREAQGSK